MPSVLVTTADQCISVTLPADYDELLRSPVFRSFLRADARVDVRLLLRLVPPSELDPAWLHGAERRGPPFTRYPILNCETVGQRYSARAADELVLLQPAEVSFLHPATWSMESFAFAVPERQQHLRWILVRLLGSRMAALGGALLHGSGFVVGGVAGAVIGPPDAGKTSAARLMRADRLLSDDMVAVSWAGREPRLHATPLGRESDGMGSAPLRAVFFPSKQTAFSLRRVLHTEALAWTVAGQGEYLSALFRPCLQAAIANLSRLLRTIPAYELGFSLDDFDHEAVRRVLLPG